jgi:hypothetical protein
MLSHVYSDLGTRGKRNFKNSIAIVDEVDNMLIDNIANLSQLSCPMPGMNSLNIIFTSIWQ